MSDLPERICGECGLPISVCNAVAVIREARKRGHEIPEIAAKDAEIARLEAEADARDEQIAAMVAASGQECACGYEKPGDVCLAHLPLYLKREADHKAEISKLRKALVRARMIVEDQEANDLYVKGHVKKVLRAIDAALNKK